MSSEETGILLLTNTIISCSQPLEFWRLNSLSAATVVDPGNRISCICQRLKAHEVGVGFIKMISKIGPILFHHLVEVSFLDVQR